MNYRIKCDFLLSIIPPSKIKELFLSNQVCCSFTFALLITLSKEQSFFYKKRKTKLSILKIIRHISNPPLNLYEKFSYKKLISFFFLRFHRNYVRYIGCRWSKKNNNDQCVVARGLLALRYKSSFSFLPLARFSQSTDSRSSRKHTQRVERDSILQFNCRPAGSLIIRVAFIFFIVEQSRATNVRR